MDSTGEFHFKTNYDDDAEEIEADASEPAAFRSCMGVQATPARDKEEEDAVFSDTKLSRADFREFARLRALQEKVHRRR